MAAKKVKSNGHPANPPAAIQLQVLRPENYPSLYANNVQFSASQWDIRLDFGEIQTPPAGALPPTAQVVIQKIGVILTPTFAKVVAETLSQMIKQHEEVIASQTALAPPKSS